MTSIQDFLGLATTLVILGLIVAGVMKVFQISTDLQESKEILKDIRRNLEGYGPSMSPGLPVPSQVSAPPPTAAPTAEELVRAIHAKDFRGENFPL